MIPEALPPKGTVYYHFRKWSKDCTWHNLNEQLTKMVRVAAGREEKPSAGSIDSQTVKSGEVAESRGYDAGKKITGRKRHILVDTEGLLLKVKVTPANVQDRDGAKILLSEFKHESLFQRLHLIWADGIYRGKLIDWVFQTLSLLLCIVTRPKGSKGFVLLKRRWVVERTFGWFNHFRRLSKDYEQQTENSEAMIYAAMCRLMLKRLARRQTLAS